jgi:hypothetical protein
MNTNIDGVAFADWVSMSALGILLWLIGHFDRRKLYPISVPRWLALLCGRTGQNNPIVHLRSFVVQMIGLLLFAWTTILVLLVASHEQRVFLFRWGVVILFLLAGLFVLLKQFIERHRCL